MWDWILWDQAKPSLRDQTCRLLCKEDEEKMVKHYRTGRPFSLVFEANNKNPAK